MWSRGSLPQSTLPFNLENRKGAQRSGGHPGQAQVPRSVPGSRPCASTSARFRFLCRGLGPHHPRGPLSPALGTAVFLANQNKEDLLVFPIKHSNCNFLIPRNW